MLVNGFQPNWIYSPSDIINQFIILSGIDLKLIPDNDLVLLEKIKLGKVKINLDNISVLTKTFGGSRNFWLNLQNQYDEYFVHLNYKSIDPHFSDFKYIISELKSDKYLPSNQIDYLDQVNLKSFYGIKEFQSLDSKTVVSNILGSRLKAIGKYSISDLNLATYIRKVELEANKQFGSSDLVWNKDRLLSRVEEIKELTKNRNIIKILPELISLLNECGVALVLAPTMPKTPICGLAKFLKNGKAVIALTPKYNKDYIFWQTLFHELGHLVLHENEMVFCDADEEDEKKSLIEVEADTFMFDKLLHPISHRDLEGYIDLKLIRRSKIDGWKEICKKARELNISSSLLTGILKKMGLIPYSYYNDRHQNIFD
ncbi:hypothetical protein [Acinetobacter courvalinii]|uniref:hypothetical protein n=1 Tax=Acinetobacter courvalinii TaxID=280147 RepID=UPI0002CFD4BF|nr:hypothetical protein [Acinetobacter courvalinii]ENX09172.1 hypothetical protein F898_00972 [Acinetobacter courvalinii]